MANLAVIQPHPSWFKRLLFALVLRARVNAPGPEAPAKPVQTWTWGDGGTW